MKEYFVVYKVTNLISNKIYIGTHVTSNLDSKYMGSNKYLLYSINKHGTENFKKEILFTFDDAADMYVKKAELVTTEFIAEQNTYNTIEGGFHSWDTPNV